MRRTIVDAHRQAALPRGWVILGMALAAWALVALAVQTASGLFIYIAASF
jgi:hypothetical protein